MAGSPHPRKRPSWICTRSCPDHSGDRPAGSPAWLVLPGKAGPLLGKGMVNPSHPIIARNGVTVREVSRLEFPRNRILALRNGRRQWPPNLPPRFSAADPRSCRQPPADPSPLANRIASRYPPAATADTSISSRFAAGSWLSAFGFGFRR